MTPDESHLYVPRHPPVKKGGVVQQPNGDWVANARTAAEAWKAAMDNRKRPCVMSPMDELTYCLDPISRTVSITTDTAIQLCEANPYRVVLILSVGSTGQTPLFVSPQPNTLQFSSIGIPMTQSHPVLILTQKDHLCLAQSAWWCYVLSSFGIINVTEVILRDWPSNTPQQQTMPPVPESEGSPSPTGGSGLDPRWS